ncbi:DNA-binding protein [Nitrincola alkalilacustris]|uniref:DNA-binding protein n=1 Tax=Nitrincola alkalilacustris TaxID=1571224 RepID=UPI00124DCC89|nr:DNA-binding protein [Nitrincola alkalilacustris]
MAKPNRTRELVHQAADQLLQQGTRPTQQNVRDLIGTGSLTTINKALGEWWQQLSQRMSRQEQHPELPEPVLTLAAQTWDRALAYAEDRFRSERQELASRQQSLEEALRQAEAGGGQAARGLQAQNGRLLEKCEVLHDEKRELERHNMQLEERTFRLTAENESLARQVKIGGGAGQGGKADLLIETQVKVRIQEEEIDRLKRKNDELLNENAQLRKQLMAR